MKIQHALPIAALAIGVTATFAAHAAGKIEVSFLEPAKYTDVGFSDRERERTVQQLGDVFKRLEGRMPEGQTLKVVVLDVDLAGNMRRHFPQEQRLMLGAADWPKIKLSYTLSSDGRTLKSGEESLADMNYMSRTPQVKNSTRPLPYEERMLEDWFEKQIAGAQAQ